jgi:hypothetical protein
MASERKKTAEANSPPSLHQIEDVAWRGRGRGNDMLICTIGISGTKNKLFN